MKNSSKKALAAHKKLQGKIEIVSKGKIKGPADLSIYYTPGVGEVSSFLAKHPKLAREYTIRRNTVAIVSDGSAVLGLGNLGPIGALPVMEGKAMLFKELGGVNAFPIVLNTQDSEEIIKIVAAIAPTFGGINLEDISAPRCFYVERKLKEMLDIPVFHDDQHGAAIVTLAGLLNALKLAKKSLAKVRIVVMGAGAAGTAIANIVIRAGAKKVLVLDSKGLIYRGRPGLDEFKSELARRTNPENKKGMLDEAIKNADVFIGASVAGILKEHHVRSMAAKPIVFALSNPVPEIDPALAKRAGAFIVATGRSDYPNQINNSLVFPGIFRGALDNDVRRITEEMKIKAAKKLAALVTKPTPSCIIPSAFDKRVMPAVASAVR